ncbi:MAG: hypothetical protein OSB67_07690 [Alphaproteobacteria bacterium]|nr:hypothetical protein [Alphaproteobacteria bacterium]
MLLFLRKKACPTRNGLRSDFIFNGKYLSRRGLLTGLRRPRCGLQCDERNSARPHGILPDRWRTIGAGRARLIGVEGLDLQPSGGTHVARTDEIGSITVTKIESRAVKTGISQLFSMTTTRIV